MELTCCTLVLHKIDHMDLYLKLTILHQILDPSKNTLPYLYTLLAYARSSPEYQAKGTNSRTIPVLDPRGELWVKVMDFLDRFESRQVRYAGVEFRKLIDIVLKTAKISKKVGITPRISVLFIPLLTFKSLC